ncbi:MAG: asparagine synthase (glutamine-hydrolyzing) [Bryobacteraceae bacterium]
MCGIAGFAGQPERSPAQVLPAQVLEDMLDSIRHRGPDDSGMHLDGSTAIGMRRLSILDLATGHQPIPNEDESCWIVFNGEIYNHLDLRAGLERSGHRFRTRSDTETILHLYEQHGPEAVAKLRGMFAIAIWNVRSKTLFLARDRFGKKPLYYTHNPSGFYFASEIKCLRAAGIRLSPNREALRLYFKFGYVPDPLSAFEDVHKLMPGTWLELDTRSGAQRRGEYWHSPAPDTDERPGFDAEQSLQRLREVFDESVRLRLMADVPVGAFLSGGIDSTLVVASMAQQTKEPVRTFSIGFVEAEASELPYARLVAERYKTQHHEIVVRPDSVGLIHKIVRHCDEPFGDSSAIPTAMVSEFAAQHVKVALSGDGGDELFGGYPRYQSIARLEELGSMPGIARFALDQMSGLLPYRALGKNYLRMITRRNGLERYFEKNYAPWFVRQNLLTPDYMLPDDDDYLARIFESQLRHAPADTLSQAEYWETSVNLPGDMLVKVDRMSMAYSLEVRCPLLDHELAGVAAGFPHSWRIRNGRGKYNLIRAMEDRIPPELLHRPKTGFGIPIAGWFRGELRELLQDTLLSPTFLGRNIVSPSFLRRMMEEHQSARRDNSHWLWWLLMLELWFQEYPVPA